MDCMGLFRVFRWPDKLMLGLKVWHGALNMASGGLFATGCLHGYACFE